MREKNIRIYRGYNREYSLVGSERTSGEPDNLTENLINYLTYFVNKRILQIMVGPCTTIHVVLQPCTTGTPMHPYTHGPPEDTCTRHAELPPLAPAGAAEGRRWGTPTVRG